LENKEIQAASYQNHKNQQTEIKFQQHQMALSTHSSVQTPAVPQVSINHAARHSPDTAKALLKAPARQIQGSGWGQTIITFISHGNDIVRLKPWAGHTTNQSCNSIAGQR